MLKISISPSNMCVKDERCVMVKKYISVADYGALLSNVGYHEHGSQTITTSHAVVAAAAVVNVLCKNSKRKSTH